MITKQEAIEAREFHYNCTASVGRRGGITHHPVVYRRTGVTQLWKTRPDHFLVPTKRGLYDHVHITNLSAEHFTTDKTCPVCAAVRDHASDPDALRKMLDDIRQGG